MSREEMIEILIEDRLWDWVYARNSDGLEDWLRMGFKGFDDLTNKELKCAFSELEEQGRVGEVKKMLKRKYLESKDNYG